MLAGADGAINKVNSCRYLTCVCYGEASMLVHCIPDFAEPDTFEFEGIVIGDAFFVRMRTIDHN